MNRHIDWWLVSFPVVSVIGAIAYFASPGFRLAIGLATPVLWLGLALINSNVCERVARAIALIGAGLRGIPTTNHSGQ